MRWPGKEGSFKTDTVLLYNSTCNEVLDWGVPALFHVPKKNRKGLGSPLPPQHHVVERFKLFLDDDASNKSNKLHLPPKLDYRKAISDYLNKMKGVIEETLDKRFPGLSLSQVLFVLCVPAEWGPHTKAIMRDCAYAAGLLDKSITSHLEFTTEPEAAALHCRSVIKEHDIKVGDTFLVVDCGGGTVDLTMRTLLPGSRLREETERTGKLCGSTYVDQEFLQVMSRKLGANALQRIRSYAYGDLQKLVHEFFCKKVKVNFTGEPDKFKTIELDLERQCPSLMKYITGTERTKLENNEWVIELEFETVKKMFDPVIKKIIKLINDQLLDLTAKQVKRKCKAMFLVGGFSESPYLIKRVREKFQGCVPTIASPPHPIAAIVKGAVKYGLDKNQVKSRVLKWTYGVEVMEDFDIRNDPPSLRTSDNKIVKFNPLAYRGDDVEVDKPINGEFKPLNNDQTVAKFHIFITKDLKPKYIQNSGMRPLGTLSVDLSRKPSLGRNYPVRLEFGLTFGTMEIKATAKNKSTDQIYCTTFDLDVDV